METRNRDKDISEDKNLVPVTTAKILPASGFQKIKSWFNGNTGNSIIGSIMVDIIVPTGKEILSRTFDLLIYKGEGRPDRRRPGGTSSRVQYDGYFDRPYGSSYQSSQSSTRREQPYSSYMGCTALDYDHIYVDTRAEAIDVLDKLDRLMDNYHIVTVSELYTIVNIKGAHTANKYGWTDLSTADFVSTSGGYLLKLPRAMPID